MKAKCSVVETFIRGLLDKPLDETPTNQVLKLVLKGGNHDVKRLVRVLNLLPKMDIDDNSHIYVCIRNGRIEDYFINVQRVVYHIHPSSNPRLNANSEVHEGILYYSNQFATEHWSEVLRFNPSSLLGQM